MSEGKRAERRLGLLLVAPAAIVMLAVTGYPILYSVWLSLQRYDLRFPDDREFVWFANYAAVLTNSYWWTAFGVTMLITVVSVAIEFVLGMALALIMHRTLVGRGLVRTVTLIPYGIVTVVAAFSWFYAWTPGTGYLANALTPGSAPLTEQGSSLAIIILAEVWKTTPFMALLLMAGLALVPEDLLKAASMDGANAWQRFTKVMLPVMKPAILVALLFRTLDAFRDLRQHLRADRRRQRHFLGVDADLQQPDEGAQPRHRLHDGRADLHRGGDHRVPLHQGVRHGRAGQRRRGSADGHPAGDVPRRSKCAGAVIDIIVVVYALVPVLWIISLSFKTKETLADGNFMPEGVDARELPGASSQTTSSSGRCSTRSVSRSSPR